MPMLRLATTSSVSLLAIAIANSPFIVNAGDAGLELFQCKASGTITMTDAPGFQPVSEEINVELMV